MSESTEQEVFAVIATHCGEGVGAILPTSNLTDLGIDSLEAIEIIFDIEEHFNVTLPDRDPNFDTGSVQGLVNAVESALAAKASAAEIPGGAAPAASA
jgi:acyl carrier protein